MKPKNAEHCAQLLSEARARIMELSAEIKHETRRADELRDQLEDRSRELALAENKITRIEENGQCCIITEGNHCVGPKLLTNVETLLKLGDDLASTLTACDELNSNVHWWGDDGHKQCTGREKARALLLTWKEKTGKMYRAKHPHEHTTN